MYRPSLPPFTAETAAQKVRMTEDAWNTRDCARVALAYTPDSRWRNRVERRRCFEVPTQKYRHQDDQSWAGGRAEGQRPRRISGNSSMPTGKRAFRGRPYRPQSRMALTANSYRRSFGLAMVRSTPFRFSAWPDRLALRQDAEWQPAYGSLD
jgi:hypothetical protein